MFETEKIKLPSTDEYWCEQAAGLIKIQRPELNELDQAALIAAYARSIRFKELCSSINSDALVAEYQNNANDSV
ncbi:hypothetical protein H0V99_03370 [Candidatus Saccharibacteria bacterium]|nr:hypothetical protein [Candidatus Saccharibacteria bacterium]